MQAFDEETSRMVGDVLLWCIQDLAGTKGEVKQTYADNKEAFDRLTETDKQRLRKAWAIALERLKDG
jgi:hypothetical protein